MWAASQRCVQGPEAFWPRRWWSGTHRPRPPDSHVLRSTVRLDEQSSVWNRQLFSGRGGASACASASALGILKTLKGADQAQVLCRQRDTEKLSVSVSPEASGPPPPPPNLLLTVMSEDAALNCLIYACNVSCLFRCRWSEFAGRLPGKHQQSLIMENSPRSGSEHRRIQRWRRLLIDLAFSEGGRNYQPTATKTHACVTFTPLRLWT